MLRPCNVRRSLAAALVPALLLSVAACGEDAPSPVAIQGLEDFEAVTIDGAPGTKPEVTWKDQLEADDLEVETLVEGDGGEVAQGDKVRINLWIGNGFSQEETYTTYGEGGAQEVTFDDENLAPIFAAALEGQTKGSRVAVVGSAEEAFGGEGGNPSLGIGNKDTVLLVVDIVGDPLTGPRGTQQTPPPWAPRVLKDGKRPTGFDFRGTPAPTAQLRKALLVEGDGPLVQEGQSITVKYVGQVYGGAKPFDQNFTGEPMTKAIGVGGFIKGWDQGLVGVPVGSRVLLSIPPALGYGKKGNPQAGIKGTDTLFFLVDVLGTA